MTGSFLEYIITCKNVANEEADRLNRVKKSPPPRRVAFPIIIQLRVCQVAVR